MDDLTPHRAPDSTRSLIEAEASVGRPVGCESIQAVLMEYLDHEVGGNVSVLVREHLRRCADCRAEAAMLGEMVASLRELDPARGAASELSRKRRRRVLWAWTHPVMAWCVLRHRRVSLAAVLVVFLALFLALRQWRMFKAVPKGIPVIVAPREE